MTTAIAIASAHVAMVSPTLARNEPFLARSAALPSTVDGSGRSPVHPAGPQGQLGGTEQQTSPAAPR